MQKAQRAQAAGLVIGTLSGWLVDSVTCAALKHETLLQKELKPPWFVTSCDVNDLNHVSV